MSEKFKSAISRQWLWKTESMKAMAIAITQLALEKDEFAADDLPADMDHGGTGIAGSAFRILSENEIIRQVGIVRGDQFFGKDRASKRDGRNGNRIKVYQLADRAKAISLLGGKHKVKFGPVQTSILEVV